MNNGNEFSDQNDSLDQEQGDENDFDDARPLITGERTVEAPNFKVSGVTTLFEVTGRLSDFGFRDIYIGSRGVSRNVPIQ